MIELYEKKGYLFVRNLLLMHILGVPKENAEKIIKILSKYKRAFVDIMMAEELGIPADTVDEVPYKHGMV
jgi:hypothetical protein